MSAKNYNSFPEAAEILKKQDGTIAAIRKRQTFEQMVENEVVP
jgi:diaminopimelate decarboxylase